MPAHTSRTIVVTSANSPTGRDVVARLTGGADRVVALVREPSDLPADEVVTDWMNSPRADEVLAEADVVVHLSGVFAAPTWESYQVGNVETTRRVLTALRDNTPRFVYISYVGADSASDNWYVKSKGAAEDLLSGTSGEKVIFRVHPIVRGSNDPSPFERMMRQSAPDAAVRVIGDGTQRFRPVFVDDVIDAIAAAVAGAGKPGTYDLVGPSAELTWHYEADSIPIILRHKSRPRQYDLSSAPIMLTTAST